MTRIEVDIPEGTSGDYEIAIYTDETTEKDWQLYLSMPKCANESSDSWTVLLKENCLMPIMQNSDAEYVEHQWLWNNATGDVLIGGLGLGMCHQPLIDNEAVTSVTIIEVAQDVVDLVWEDCAKDDTFSVVVADFETWTPPENSSFDTVWGDSWLVDNSMTYSEYRTFMTERYSQYTDNIGFWGD
jgi:hypothetical protein